MSPSRRQLLVAIGLVLAISAIAIALDGQGPTTTSAPESPDSADSITLFEPTPNTSALWPYTSRSESVAGRTLAINVVVHGEPDRVRQALTRQTDANWDRTTGEDARDADAEAVEAIEIDGVGVEWRPARGAARYTYIADSSGSGSWVRERYQLHDGDYFGSRYHIRAYAAPDGKWTALQAHEEYFDWFRLRHTVTGAASAQRFVEADLRDESFVTELRRTWTGHRWLTKIDLASVAILALGISWRDLLGRLREKKVHERIDPAALALFGTTCGLVFAVRFGGVAFERAFPDLSPKLLAGLLYPLLALGLPFVTVVLARWTEPLGGFVAAGSGLSLGFVVDFAVLGIDVLPVSVALHRVAVVVALGLVAVAASTDGDHQMGSTHRERANRRGWLVAGLVGWLVVLVLPLSGLL